MIDDFPQLPQVKSGEEIKVTQRMDFNGYIFFYRQKMAEVLARSDLVSYELMQNALWHILAPYWNDELLAEWDKAMSLGHPDRAHPSNRIRIYEKDRIISKLLDDIGALFKRKKKMRIKLLFDLYPPYEVKK